MKKPIYVLDFDGSITAQHSFNAQFDDRITVRNLRKYEHAARLWVNSKNYSTLCQQAIKGMKPSFSLIGSGDYHHFSLGLIAEYTDPLTVVLFDNHPDWMKPPHQYHCGTWVYSLARLPHVARIIIIGLESGDIAQKNFANGDVESYLNHKIILLPYQAVEVAVASQNKHVLKSSLSQDLRQGIAEVMKHITTQQVYISVDKDCLRLEDAYTNWEQGSLPLSTVVSTIQAIGQKFEIVGADTVGDYSPPSFRSPLKWAASWLDRRVFRKPVGSEILRKNALANIALLKACDGTL